MLSVVWVWYTLPETKGKALEEIEAEFRSKMQATRDNGGGGCGVACLLSCIGADGEDGEEGEEEEPLLNSRIVEN